MIGIVDTYVFLPWGLTFLYAVVMLFLIRGWYLIASPRYTNNTYKTKVTILIAARNEEANIAATIDDLLAQHYPKELTEIIIADDHSTDRTAEIITDYADRGVKLLQLTDTTVLNSYKKKAITEAISQSEGELMIATDADCRMGTEWLANMVSYYETYGPVMISGPVTYFHEKSFFEHLQTLEFSFLIGIGASFIGNKHASTCNGANLAYRKDVFYDVGGFTGIDDVASGDDELLLQKVAAKYPGKIGFLKRREAVVYTYAKHSLSSFLQQRRRWASKATKYKDKGVVAIAAGLWLFNLTIILNFIISLYFYWFQSIFFIQLGTKILLEALFLNPILGFFKRRILLLGLLILSPLHVIYVVYIFLAGNTKKYLWKGRMVR